MVVCCISCLFNVWTCLLIAVVRALSQWTLQLDHVVCACDLSLPMSVIPCLWLMVWLIRKRGRWKIWEGLVKLRNIRGYVARFCMGDNRLQNYWLIINIEEGIFESLNNSVYFQLTVLIWRALIYYAYVEQVPISLIFLFLFNISYFYLRFNLLIKKEKWFLN